MWGKGITGNGKLTCGGGRRMKKQYNDIYNSVFHISENVFLDRVFALTDSKPSFPAYLGLKLLSLIGFSL